MENKLNLPLKKKKNEAESPRLDPLMRALKALHSAGAPETMTEEELEHQRRSQEVLGRLTAPMAGMDYEEFSLGGMNAAWMRLKAPHGSRHAVLYCHGGGYTSGNLGYARVLASKLAHVTGYDVLSFEYRLAPEHPYPAAVEDALRAWDHLMLLGYGARDVVLAGDSAGGNLALVLCHRLKAAGRRPRKERREIGRGVVPPAGVGGAHGLNVLRREHRVALRALGVGRARHRHVGMWHVFQMFPLRKAAAAMESVARFLLER